MNLRILNAFSILLLVGCDTNHVDMPTSRDSTNATPVAQQKPQKVQSIKQSLALRNILIALASPESASWITFDDVPGIKWRDMQPIADGHGYSQAGNILLSGFDVKHLPNGKVGIAADSKEDNEGNSGITLNGSKSVVSSISIVKFYPSENYQKIVQWQLLAEDEIALLANNCLIDEISSTANYQKNMFFKISLSNGHTLYFEAYVDEEGSKYNPGSTTFIFYRDKPSERISKMQCDEI